MAHARELVVRMIAERRLVAASRVIEIVSNGRLPAAAPLVGTLRDISRVEQPKRARRNGTVALSLPQILLQLESSDWGFASVLTPGAVIGRY